MNYSPRNNEKELEKNKATGKKVRNKFLIITLRVLLFVFLISAFALVGLVLGAYIGIIQNSPDISTAIQPENYTTIIYLDETGEEYERLDAVENREYVELENISPYLRDAFVAIEDKRFYEHNGVDIKGMFRALYVNLTEPKRREGASTITQQLIKNNVTNVLTNTLDSKLQEQYMAVRYEKALAEELGSKEKAKERILEVYLNTIGLHHNLNGVQTAANYYFGKDVKDLNLTESAVIAAITQNPSKYTPVNHPDNNKVRMEMVLDEMLELGFITQAEYDEALLDDVYSRISGFREIKEQDTKIHTYYLDYVKEVVTEDLKNKYNISSQEASNWVFNKGLKIYIPFDENMQTIVDEVISDPAMYPSHLNNIEVAYTLYLKNVLTNKVEEPIYKVKTINSEAEKEAFIKSVQNDYMGSNHVIHSEYVTEVLEPQAAFVLMDYHTGNVKAISGGRGKKEINLGFNRATQARRSPGSVFKVLSTYAPGLELGAITPGTVTEDSYFKLGDFAPKNWWGSSYRGLTTVRQGIVTSANIVTVKLMDQIGVDRCFDFLTNKFKFSTLLSEVENGNSDRGLSTALGGLTHGVLQTEVAAAYGAIANSGVYNEPKFYTKVFNHNDELLLDNTAKEPERILSEGNAYILTDMMSEVLSSSSGTGGKARFQYVNMPTAGKTGTTTETKDLTFAGYTPYYVGSIWTGYDNSTSLGNGTDNYHLKMWRIIMERVHENLEYKDFPRPDNVVSVSICKDSGKLPGSYCSSDYRGSRVFKELFIAGTEPTGYCDVHGGGVRICTVSGKLATRYCPADSIEIRSGGYSSDYCDIHTESGTIEPEVEETTSSETSEEATTEATSTMTTETTTSGTIPPPTSLTPPTVAPETTEPEETPTPTSVPTPPPEIPTFEEPEPTPIEEDLEILE